MKFKLSTIFISVFLVGLLLYGFVSLTSSDPYGDYAPGTELSIANTNGTADTTTPGNWPYPTVWNFNYSGIANVNGGTVGACYYADKYWLNRWNSTNVYLFANSGTNGGPGGTPTTITYTGSIRDMSVAPDGSGSDFIWGGKASTTLYKFSPTGTTLGTYSVPQQMRAFVWDPNRKGFWAANWTTDIKCFDTTGAIKDTYAGGLALASKYGMAWDSGHAHVDTATLFVWHQTPGQTLTEVNLTTKTTIRSFLISAGTNIAGGAEAYKSPVNNDWWLVLNYQNYANVAYKIGTGGGPGPNPGFPESFESTTFPPTGWGKFNVGGGTGWTRLTVGTSPIPGWTGGVITSPPGGENAVAFCTWNTGGPTGNDQYLYTPQISGINITDADSITYWLKRTYNSYADTVELRVSTTTPTAGGFSNLLKTHAYPASGSDTNWVRFAVSLAGFSGQNIYVAWREKVANNLTNGAAISLDLVDIAGTIVGVTNNQTPGAYDLSQNYPNPFNPTTTINFSIQKQGLVTLKVYDLLGKEVATLVNDPKVAGSYSVNFNGENLSSGVYFYRLEVNDFVSVKRMLLVK